MAKKQTEKTASNLKNNTAQIGNSVASYNIFEATVSNCAPFSNQILFASGNETPRLAHVAINLMSPILGINKIIVLEKGCRVLILSIAETTYYVIGILSSQYSFSEAAAMNYIGFDKNAVNCGGVSDDARDVFKTYTNSYTARDFNAGLTDGEETLTSALGAGLELRLHLARLKGSDLACVETYMFDDFVRIISKNFEHITSFGNYRIVNNGNNKVSVVWEGSTYEHETMGLTKQNEETGIEEENDNNIKIDDTDSSFMYENDGRWRFTQYIGYLGNVFNLYITDPTPNLIPDTEDDTQSKSYKSARSRIHENADGSILVQSVSDIIIEKVVKIPVPYTKKRLEEDLSEVSTQLTALTQWQSNDVNLLDIAYNLHDYSKWFSLYYSLATTYMSIPEEEDTDFPEEYLGDETYERSQNATSHSKTYDVMKTSYATIRILKNGSITLYDSYGSCIQMNGGDVSISAAKNLNLSACGNVNIKAGADITNLAKNNIELTAVTQGILLKSKLWFEALCTRGQMLLKSTFSSDYTPTEAEGYTDSICSSYETRKERNGADNGLILSTITHESSSDGSSKVENSSNIIVKTNIYIQDALHYINRAKNVLFTLPSSAGAFIIRQAMLVSNTAVSFYKKIIAPTLSAMQLYQKNGKKQTVYGTKVESLTYNADSYVYPKYLDDYSSTDLNTSLDHDYATYELKVAETSTLNYRDNVCYDTTDPSVRSISEYNNYTDLTSSFLYNNKEVAENLGYEFIDSTTLFDDYDDGVKGYPYPGVTILKYNLQYTSNMVDNTARDSIKNFNNTIASIDSLSFISLEHNNVETSIKLTSII